MSKRGKPRWPGRLAVGSWLLIVPGAGALVTGCAERDRLTFPSQSDGIGPVTVIDQPAGGDTTIDAGPPFFVNGRSIDSDGVDTVRFLVAGGNQGFPPLHPSSRTDTVRFGVPISTNGRSGQAVQFQAYGVDREGNQGGTAFRQIIIR